MKVVETAKGNIKITLHRDEAQRLFEHLGNDGGGNGVVEGFASLWVELERVGLAFRQ